MGLRQAADGLEMRAAERQLHQVVRAEADVLAGAALQARVADAEFLETSRAHAHEQAHEAGTQLRSKGMRPTSVRLLGGSVVHVLALMMVPATAKGTSRARGQRGPAGSGVYPALAQLGIAGRSSPALREEVARQVVSSNSVAAARQALEQRGIRLDHRTALRLTYAFAQSAMDARDHALRSLEPGEKGAQDQCGGPLSGERVVVCLDGGRVRLKEAPEDPTEPEPPSNPNAEVPSDVVVEDPDDGTDRRYTPAWREPKLLTIYVVNDAGKRDRAFSAIVDGTLGDADEVTQLLIGYLRLYGAHEAASVCFIADGGSWIWQRTASIRKAAKIAKERWSEQLDLPHTMAYLGRLLTDLDEGAVDKKVWLAEQKTSLLRGDLDEVLDAVRYLSVAHGTDVAAAEAFLEKHRSRLCFLFCRSDGQPMGSGAVESAIRRVVNLRLKGNSIYWLREHAEAVIHLRAQLVTGRWEEMVERIFNRPTWTPPRSADS